MLARQFMKKKSQVQQSESDFVSKNKKMLEQVLRVNNEVKAFAIHLSQNCKIEQEGQQVDLQQQFNAIVEHMDRMNFVFESMKKLK